MGIRQWLLYGLPLFCRGLVHRRDVERDLDDELAFHFEQLIAEQIERGQTPEAARAVAGREMRRVDQSKDACRDAWHTALVDRSRRDIGDALRRLRRAPGPTAVALVTLAIAIGANTAIFSVVNAVFLRPSSIPDVDRIVWMVEKNAQGAPAGVSALNYLDWQQQNTTLASLAAWDSTSVTLGDGVEPTQVRSLVVSPAYFEIFKLAPILGRTFRSDESEVGRSDVVILSREVWTSRFGADPGIVGRVVHVRGDPYVVVGVMGPDASGINWGWPQVWTPLSLPPESLSRNYHRFHTYGRIRPGVSLADVRADMAHVSATLAQDHPDTNRGWGVTIEPYEDTMIGDGLRHSLSLLFAAVGAVLLVGSVNLANLALTRVRNLAQEATLPGIYVPLDQSPTRRPALVVRANGDAASLERTVIKAVAAVNVDQALSDVRTLEQLKDTFIVPDRQRTFLTALFACIATLLAGVGIYGVTAAAVSQRIHEFGIRAAVGATAGRLALLVLSQTLLLTACGLAIGAVASLALGRVMAALIHVPDIHPAGLAIPAFILGSVAVVGCAVPAARAAGISPLEAIRQ